MSAPRLVLAEAPKMELLGRAFESIFSGDAKKPTSSTHRGLQKIFLMTHAMFNARHLLDCCGRSSFITSTFAPGSTGILPATSARIAQEGPQSGMVQSLQRGHYLHPDKWEYPWYAAWDLAFHCIPLAQVDPDFAKEQLTLLLREWYMHPNGQLPAYEWAFGDVKPASPRLGGMARLQNRKARARKADRDFLESAFHKLLLNFTWWVNRKDAEGMNIFQGGFLG